MKTAFLSLLSLLLAVVPSRAQSPLTYQPVPNEPIALEADVTRLYPDAVIIREGHYTEKNGAFELPPGTGLAPALVWIEKSGDWIEPANAVEPAKRLQVGSSEMKLTEVHGDVQVMLPDVGNKTLQGSDGLQVPEGAVVQVAPGGSAAVLMGGVNSVRLIGDSEARLNQSLSDGQRQTTIMLTKGGIFSRVGQKLNEKQSFKVKTPFGIAAAKGTDYVTLCLPQRMDVWIAQGTVQVNEASGSAVGTVSAEPGALKILRTPVIPNTVAAAAADSETMGAAVRLIPGLNRKAVELRQKDPATLTEEEKTFLGQIRRFTWLVKAQKAESAAPSNTQSPSLQLTPPAPEPVPGTLMP